MQQDDDIVVTLVLVILILAHNETHPTLKLSTVHIDIQYCKLNSLTVNIRLQLKSDEQSRAGSSCWCEGSAAIAICWGCAGLKAE